MIFLLGEKMALMCLSGSVLVCVGVACLRPYRIASIRSINLVFSFYFGKRAEKLCNFRRANRRIVIQSSHRTEAGDWLGFSICGVKGRLLFYFRRV